MANDEVDICPLCQRGHLIMRNEEIAFHQSTDKGDISCRAVIPMEICDHCGSKSWGAEAEEIIAAAVKGSYDKLP
jgi:hypothetical protein